jgi:hypothetical protein
VRPAAGQPPDYGDGGAYPDVHVIQYPLQMGAGKLGPGGIPPQLDIDYAELQVSATLRAAPDGCTAAEARPQGAAGRALLAAGAGPTAEHDALCAFLKVHSQAPLAGLPAAVRIRRAADVPPGAAALAADACGACAETTTY